MPNFWITLLGIGLFGGLGAVARLLLSAWHAKLPWGILVANTTGALVVGFMFGLQLEPNLAWDRNLMTIWVAFLATGFAGGLSTFSSWAAQTVHFFSQNERRQGYLNFVFNLVLPVCAIITGIFIAVSLLK